MHTKIPKCLVAVFLAIAQPDFETLVYPALDTYLSLFYVRIRRPCGQGQGWHTLHLAPIHSAQFVWSEPTALWEKGHIHVGKACINSGKIHLNTGKLFS